MRFPSNDVSSMIWIPVVIIFWGIIGFQWIRNHRLTERIKKTAVCQFCRNKNLEIEVYTLNQRTKHKVSIMKNIGGAYLLFIPGVFLLKGFFLYLSDLISGGNVSGIQNEELVGKIGIVSFPLIIGLSMVVISIFLVLEFLIGEKIKTIKFTCNACKMVYFSKQSQT